MVIIAINSFVINTRGLHNKKKTIHTTVDTPWYRVECNGFTLSFSLINTILCVFFFFLLLLFHLFYSIWTVWFIMQFKCVCARTDSTKSDFYFQRIFFASACMTWLLWNHLFIIIFGFFRMSATYTASQINKRWHFSNDKLHSVILVVLRCVWNQRKPMLTLIKSKMQTVRLC